MSATGYTPISLYYSTTAAAVPVNTNLANGELAINITDGKLYYKNNSGTVTLLAAASGASGDVVGPASATDTAVALFDGTTGKLIKNSPVTIGTTGNTVISGTDNTNAMLRITQLGTGNALLVEDSTNPDSTPFVVTSDGRFIHGHTSALSPRSVTFSNQFIGSDFSGSAPLSLRYSNDASPTGYEFSKTRSTTPSGNAIVVSGDSVGTLIFSADDGTQYVQAASITAAVDGTPGTNDMPGRLVFSTTADGASTPTERMRIDSSGNVGIGVTPSAWTSGYKAYQASLGAAFAGRTSNITQAVMSANWFNDGTSKYIGTGEATLYQMTTGQHQWYTAVSGTAGNAITFTQAMTLNASGNLGIGTASATSMLQTAGSSSVSAFKTPNIAEVDTISATAATGTINYDVTTQSVLFYTSNASANWTVNFRGSSGTSLNTLMQTGESISATFLVTQGATAYYNSAVTIDGTSVTPKWQGGTAPTSGNASSVDCYTYVIQKTGSATYVVLASQTKFA